MTRIFHVLAAVCLLAVPLSHASVTLTPVPKVTDSKKKAKKQIDPEKRIKTCVTKLRSAGYVVTEQDVTNPSAPLLARFASNGNADAVKIWIECGMPVNGGYNAFIPQLSRSALTLAIEKGHDKIARMLIKAGAPLYDAAMPLNPLEAAAEHGNIKIAQTLISAGADVNKANVCPFLEPDGRLFTPLMLASDNPEMAAFLLSAGADIHAKDASGRMALFYAVARKCPECVLLYLEKGLDINVQDNLGKTPLHYAAERDNVEMVKFLWECGAKFSIKTRQGFNVFEAAQMANAAAVLDFLEKVSALLERNR